MSETITIAGEGITLDLLLWRRWGEKGAVQLEATLDLNHGLADLGVTIPPGTVVNLPDAPAQSDVVTTAVDLFA